MCLAKAYYSDKNSPVMSDISAVEVKDGKLLVKTLFGEEKELGGEILSIDFMKSSIMLQSTS